MSRTPRRAVLAAVGGLSAVAVALTGCAGSTDGGPADADTPVTLRMVWWGDTVRADATQEAIALFEQAHPNITVQGEALPFDGYFDLLSTQVAANDAPDVQQLTVDVVSDYGRRGALLHLDQVNTADLDKATTEAANVDGEQWGVASGLSTQVVVANKTLFDAAGVPLPDDTTWTWEDYVDIAAQISQNSPDGVFGAAPLGMDAISFQAFLRQQGAAAYTADGEVGFDAEDFATYLELAQELRDSGGSGGPEIASEQTALPLEQTGTALNTFAMGFWASGQYTALVSNSKQDLVPLRLPAIDAGDNQMAIGVSQYWGAASRTEHPAEAQMLIDFLVNDQEAALAMGLVRGTPPNATNATALADTLSGPDSTVTQFVTEIGREAVTVPLPPTGFASFQDVLRRYVAEYMFGRQSAQQASEGFVSEVSSLYQ